MTERTERRAAGLPTLGQIRNVLRDVASDLTHLQHDGRGPSPGEKLWHVIGYVDKLEEHEREQRHDTQAALGGLGLIVESLKAVAYALDRGGPDDDEQRAQLLEMMALAAKAAGELGRLITPE